jgi:hypothetical protein
MDLKKVFNGAVSLLGVICGIILTSLAYFNVGTHPTWLGYFGIILTMGFGLYFIWWVILQNPKRLKN